ncbi:gluconate 2-dehydrogenase subunit 3 family protein [Sediminibacterium roseum]|uniref:Gluconate 2-dehydrogenase subunit 3 family protein n=1 Tax=Sediminibacterium roseum TaxID=1978412 RepID=A0ABW9ZWM2_9BACT|nr:gluconate 2-dehydrogenase subunit 3 family protein [Sediminibacterium roseum]NCI51554.1 gluconate 2-dehydrogenase subunit 3 family protein [Sediminibacterium roseum]
MDRRKSIKALLIGTAASGVFVEACKNTDKKAIASSADAKLDDADRMEEEKAYLKKLQAGDKFFTEHEMATIVVLEDIILPKDEISGSASDAKVHDFIEFIVKDVPSHQTPLRGGLRWIDVYCLNHYGKPFKDCDKKQQIELVDQIAYPEVKDAIAKTNRVRKPEMAQGISFFNKMRDLVMTGFYTSEIGVKDIGYMGNTPNKWNGVPDDVLKQYGYAYTEKEMKECAKYDV